MDEDYLIHYGVLGMKWGVRKDRRSSSGSSKKSSSKKKSTTVEKAKKTVKANVDKKLALRKQDRLIKKALKNPRKVTDKELEQVMARINKENSLTSIANSSSVSTGKKEVKKIIADSGKAVVKTTLVKGGTYAVNYGIKKASDSSTTIDWKDVADFVAPVGNKKKKDDD